MWSKTAAAWALENQILPSGQLAFESDTLKMKAGNGSTSYNSLPYLYYTTAEIDAKLNLLLQQD